MSDRTYGKKDELKIKLNDQRKVLEDFQNRKEYTLFDEKDF
jgi:hypothetical protein